MKCDKVKFRVHAIQRMFRRQISPSEVKEVLLKGSVIARYPDDKPFPCSLLLGFRDGRPIHVVFAVTEANTCIIITVYEPDPELWEPGFERKRR